MAKHLVALRLELVAESENYCTFTPDDIAGLIKFDVGVEKDVNTVKVTLNGYSINVERIPEKLDGI